MEYCLSFCCASKPTAERAAATAELAAEEDDSPAAKWALVLATLCTAVFPLLDFVTDILVAYEFKTSEDPAEQAWGDVSIGLLGFSTFLNLGYFWRFVDVVAGGKNPDYRLWSRSHRLNVLVGFVVTAANLRAQAMACIILWTLLYRDATKAGLEGNTFAGLGAAVGTKAVTFVKLLEFFFETMPELLLQGYAVLYRRYVNGEAIVDGNAVLLASMSISIATLISGLTDTYLWANDTAVMVLGAGYFLCIVFGRMALFALLFLQFGSLGAVFASAALLLRYVCVVGERRVNDPGWVRDRYALGSMLFDPPTILIVPVGLTTYTNPKGIIRRTRARAHTADKATAGASVVLYGRDALRILALHVIEAAVGAALLRICGGRFVVPHVAAGNATGGSGDGDGDAGEFELVVEPGDILWYVVWPYCAGLAMLALLVAVDNWDAIRPKICTCRQNAPKMMQGSQEAPPPKASQPYLSTAV